MTHYRDRAKTYHNLIKKVLLHEWDPIGVSDIPEAQDEYDSYVGGVYKRLISRTKENDLFEYLWNIETDHMGLTGDRQHTMNITKKLLDLVNEIENKKNI